MSLTSGMAKRRQKKWWHCWNTIKIINQNETYGSKFQPVFAWLDLFSLIFLNGQHEYLRLHLKRCPRRSGFPERLPRKGAADCQHRDALLIDAAIYGIAAALWTLQRARFGDIGFSVQPISRTGAGEQSGNCFRLSDEVWYCIQNFWQNRCQRRIRIAALCLFEGTTAEG